MNSFLLTVIQSLLVCIVPLAVLVLLLFPLFRRFSLGRGMIIVAFLSAFLVGVIDFIMVGLFKYTGLIPDVAYFHDQVVRKEFFGAGLPEESAKFIVLLILLRCDRRYREDRRNALALSGAIGAGFAAIEAVGYFLRFDMEFCDMFLDRNLTAAPVHLLLALIMGLFAGLSGVLNDRRRELENGWKRTGIAAAMVLCLVLALVVPVAFHTVCDIQATTRMVDYPEFLIPYRISIWVLVFCIGFFGWKDLDGHRSKQ